MRKANKKFNRLWLGDTRDGLLMWTPEIVDKTKLGFDSLLKLQLNRMEIEKGTEELIRMFGE